MFNKYNSIHNDNLDNIKTFICSLEKIECDDSHSRYSKDNTGKLYNEKPKFINVRNINKFIHDLLIKFSSSIRIIKK